MSTPFKPEEAKHSPQWNFRVKQRELKLLAKKNTDPAPRPNKP
jgi:hypothetical protein